MVRYWLGDIRRHNLKSPVELFGCYVFEKGRNWAICEARGSSEEETLATAQRIVAALVAVETQPPVAAAARHYIVRSPVHKDVAVLCGEDTTLQLAYDHYFDQCEKANKTPKSFDDWKAARHD